MAGISRSVTLVIAYLMQHYGLTMQQAYQYVKEKRPAISPNLNFMGQLVEFEREVQSHGPSQHLDLSAYLPTPEQEKLSENVRARSSESSSAETTPEPIRCNEPMAQPPVQFALKPLAPKSRHKKSAPVQSLVESKSLPAVSPKSEEKTNPIVSSMPCSVSYVPSGSHSAEFPAPPLSLAASKGTAVGDPPAVVRSSHESREQLLPITTERAFVKLSIGDRTIQD